MQNPIFCFVLCLSVWLVCTTKCGHYNITAQNQNLPNLQSSKILLCREASLYTPLSAWGKKLKTVAYSGLGRIPNFGSFPPLSRPFSLKENYGGGAPPHRPTPKYDHLHTADRKPLLQNLSYRENNVLI